MSTSCCPTAARPGNSGLSYANDVTFTAFARHLRDLVQKRIDARDPKARYEVRRGPDPINALLCSHLHLAPFRFGPDATWPHGVAIANHAKLWMVDDRVFYIGSDNVYPVNLQEFGYIVDDRKAAAELLDALLEPVVAVVAAGRALRRRCRALHLSRTTVSRGDREAQGAIARRPISPISCSSNKDRRSTRPRVRVTECGSTRTRVRIHQLSWRTPGPPWPNSTLQRIEISARARPTAGAGGRQSLSRPGLSSRRQRPRTFCLARTAWSN